MGGFNSGRYGGKQQCEHSLALDVRTMARKGLLKAGSRFTWTWSNKSDISVLASDDHLTLQYAFNGGALCSYAVHLKQTPCNYGGQRVWFSCPKCQERKAKLFMKHGRFACRKCHRLRYHSQALDPMARHQWAYSRLQNRLGEDDIKPKAMHWRTFERLHDRLEDINEKIDREFNLKAGAFLRRCGIDWE